MTLTLRQRVWAHLLCKDPPPEEYKMFCLCRALGLLPSQIEGESAEWIEALYTCADVEMKVEEFKAWKP
jgi:hypothetical protein